MKIHEKCWQMFFVQIGIARVIFEPELIINIMLVKMLTSYVFKPKQSYANPKAKQCPNPSQSGKIP